MTWNIEMAKLFKQRDNKTPISAIMGQVISVEPFKISIFNGKAILSNEQLYICSSLASNYKRNADIKMDNTVYNSEITYKDILTIGDNVLCLADSTGQVFYIIDRLVM